MISIKLEQLVNSTDGLKGLAQKSLRARPALAVAKILKAADAEMTTFNETRLNLIKKYGDKDENGEVKQDEKGNVHIPNEVLDDFTKELKELLDTQVEINANKIKMSDVENVEFTPAEMAQLEDFIEFDDEPAE